MALDRENLLQLMRTTVSANPANNYSFNGETFSYSALNDTLRNELNELVGTEELYQENKRKVFSLISETIDAVLPPRLIDRWGQFAEIKTYDQGDRPVFTRRTGKVRAKQFITRVGLAGRYETFKLGSESFEVQTSAMGGAAKIGFEEFLDGRVNFAELTQIIMDGMDELLYREIAKALQSSLSQLPVNNKVTVTGFDEDAMDFIVNQANVYGKPTIYCTREFAVKMIPSQNWASDQMKNEMWNNGFLGTYKGCNVIVLPQTFEDETNSRKVIDPGYIWIIPAGADMRPVKVAFEGVTHTRECDDNDDWSRDIQVYRKVGVGVMMTNNIFSYVDTQLLGHLDVQNQW